MLPTQQVNVAFRGGLDRKTDGRLVIPSKLTQADDVEFVDHDTIVTRCGTSRINVPFGYGEPLRIFEHANVPTIEYLSGQTARANGNNLPSYYGINALTYEPDTFARVGVITRRAQSLVQKTTLPGAGVPLYAQNFDVVVANTNYIVAWEEVGYTGRMGVRWSIRSLTNDAEVQGGFFSSSGAATDIYVKPRVTYDSDNGWFGIWYAHFSSAAGNNFTVEGVLYDEAGGAPVAGPAVVITTPVAGAVEGATGLEALFDVYFAAGLGYAVSARATDATGSIYSATVDGSLAVLASGNAVNAVRPVSLTAYGADVGGFFVGFCFYGASTDLRGRRLNVGGGGALSAEVTISALGAGNLVGRVASSTSGSNLLLACDVFGATTDTHARTYLATCSTALVLSQQTYVTTNCFLSGRIFEMRSRKYLPVTFTSQQYQSVTLVLDVTAASRNLNATLLTSAQPLFVARLDWGETANPSPLAVDSAHRVPDCTSTLMPYLKFEANTRLAGTTNATPVAITFAKFAPLEQLGDGKLNGLTYLAGALPMVTDGQKMVEEGFHWNPEVIGTVTNGLVVIPPVATGTGIYDFPAIGTYVVAFTETWQDAQGNWHESGVAFLGSVTTTAGNLAINPTIVRPPTLKNDQTLLAAGGRVGLTMYRTKASSTDTTLYLAHSLELGSGAGYINDTDLGFGEPLYTEGGVLPNTPAPSCRHIGTYSGRLVLTGCGDGSKVYLSKVTDKGFAAEFISDENTFQRTIPPSAGRGVASVEMLGKLVVLAERRIGIVYGTGPNDSGVGDFTEFEPVVTDMGVVWTAPKSVRLAAEGIWFQSPFGLRLFGGQGITQGQNGRPVGSDVDDLVSGNVVALAGGNIQQTRFALATTFLVWDQVWGQFTRFTNHTSVDSCVVDGEYHLLAIGEASNTLLRKRDPVWIAADSTITAGIPGLVPVIGDVVLGDIQFGGVQGYQRVRSMHLLSKVNSLSAAPQFDVHVGYDNADPGALPEVSAVLSAATGLVLQFQHQFFTQKCETLKLRLRFHDPNGWSTVRLTDLALLVGVKRGPWKSAENK